MSVKVFWGEDGRPYAQAETPAEALELIKIGSNGFGKHSPKLKAQSPSLPALVSEEVPARVKRVFAQASEPSVAILKILAKHPQGIKGESLAEEAKQEVAAFGGILGGVTKLARKNNLKTEDFFSSEQKLDVSRRFRVYRPGKLLLEYAGLLEKLGEKLVGA